MTRPSDFRAWGLATNYAAKGMGVARILSAVFQKPLRLTQLLLLATAAAATARDSCPHTVHQKLPSRVNTTFGCFTAIPEEVPEGAKPQLSSLAKLRLHGSPKRLSHPFEFEASKPSRCLLMRARPLSKLCGTAKRPFTTNQIVEEESAILNFLTSADDQSLCLLSP